MLRLSKLFSTACAASVQKIISINSWQPIRTALRKRSWRTSTDQALVFSFTSLHAISSKNANRVTSCDTICARPSGSSYLNDVEPTIREPFAVIKCKVTFFITIWSVPEIKNQYGNVCKWPSFHWFPWWLFSFSFHWFPWWLFSFSFHWFP